MASSSFLQVPVCQNISQHLCGFPVLPQILLPEPELGKHAGRVMTYDSIIKELWGPRASGDNQILRVNMANIRRKIEKNPAEPEYLFTEVGVGYRMAESEN